MAAISLAWLMRLPGQVQPVIGTTNPQRIKDAVAADHIDLSRDDWYRLYHAAREHRLPVIITRDPLIDGQGFRGGRVVFPIRRGRAPLIVRDYQGRRPR